MINSIEYFKEKFDLLQHANKESLLGSVHQQAFNAFRTMGIPSTKHEEWKYTRVSNLFNKDYSVVLDQKRNSLSEEDIKSVRLPGHEDANELFFINGIFSFELSKILSSKQLLVMPLKEAAAGDHHEIVSNNFNHSSNYLKDGINALSAAFAQEAVFIHIKKGQATEHPVYIYNITDTRSGNTFSQPRSLIHVAENAQVQIAETYIALGTSQNFTSQVTEIVIEKDAHVEY